MKKLWPLVLVALLGVGPLADVQRTAPNCTTVDTNDPRNITHIFEITQRGETFELLQPMFDGSNVDVTEIPVGYVDVNSRVRIEFDKNIIGKCGNDFDMSVTITAQRLTKKGLVPVEVPGYFSAKKAQAQALPQPFPSIGDLEKVLLELKRQRDLFRSEIAGSSSSPKVCPTARSWRTCASLPQFFNVITSPGKAPVS